MKILEQCMVLLLLLLLLRESKGWSFGKRECDLKRRTRDKTGKVRVPFFCYLSSGLVDMMLI